VLQSTEDADEETLMGRDVLSFGSTTLLALLLAGCVITSETKNEDDDNDTGTGGTSNVGGQSTGGGSDGSSGSGATVGSAGAGATLGAGGTQGTGATTGAAGAMSAEEAACLDAGGTVSVILCCAGNGDFFNACLGEGTCSCAPELSHEVKACECPEGECFDGQTCVEAEY
jgi:hypothetical protein